jgi:hypothetical protein
METIDFSKKIEDIVADIKTAKTVTVPSWTDIVKEYDPKKHDINDTNVRKDIVKSDNTVVKVARVLYGLQKLSTKRMTQMHLRFRSKGYTKRGMIRRRRKWPMQ